MFRSKLPDIQFAQGISLHRRLPSLVGTTRDVTTWLLIGRLDGETPFLLQYTEPGMSNWSCSQTLGPSLRKKILGLVRTDVRMAQWTSFPLQSHDLRALDIQDMKRGNLQAEKLSIDFFEQVWKRRYLGINEDDMISLRVPFAEKEQAKALGATWDPVAKAWKVLRQPDMSAFSRWMPE